MNACIGDHVFSDAMIDLELLGLEYGRPIIQIGVTLFTLASAESEFVTQVFNVRVDDAEMENACPTTMEWWQQTDAELLKALLSSGAASKTLEGTLRDFCGYLETCSPARFWADYTHFDIAHLQLAMQRYGIDAPWMHNQVHASSDVKLMCRMLLGAEQEVAPHAGRREHEAGSDTLQQALELKAWFRQLATALPATVMGTLMGMASDDLPQQAAHLKN